MAVSGRRGTEDVARLVRRAASGDDEGWRELVREFGGTIWIVARGFQLRDADAADVAQATWLKLVEHIGDLHDPSRLRAWLTTTARRECLRVRRHALRHAPLDDDAPEHASTDTPPDAELLRVERDQALWDSFSRLRSSDQVLLRHLLAESRPGYKEISAALELPVGSIGPMRARTLERLRQELHRAGTFGLLAA
jgi:RNA polymerase sigma factor (sigma-70 family)